MKTIGEKFPEFKKTAVISLEAEKEFKTITNSDLKGKWSVIFWWPKDFTFVCPTEITSFNDHYEEFTQLDANLIGCSCDSEYVDLAWRTITLSGGAPSGISLLSCSIVLPSFAN